MKVIAYIKTPFGTKFGTPRQSGLVGELTGEVHFEPEFHNPDALRGLDKFEYIWLLWGFSLNREQQNWHPVVRPPRLGGNAGMGVFATRSPYRPNPLGLSSVKLLSVDYERCVLTVSGADMVDGTPIYDIKPYISYTDSHPDARCGFVDENEFCGLEVNLPDNLAEKLGTKQSEALVKVLQLDPRPQYQTGSDKVYGLTFSGHNVRFTVDDSVLTVIDIQ